MPTRGDALCDGHRRARRRAHIEGTDVCRESPLALEPEDAQWYGLRALQSGAACQILGTRKSSAPAWPVLLSVYTCRNDFVSHRRARGRGTFVRWRRQSGARRPLRRNQHPETRPKVCEPGVPRAHGAICPTPGRQISTPSPRCSGAPSREPCSATRSSSLIRGTRTRGALSWRTLNATGPRTRSRVAP